MDYMTLGLLGSVLASLLGLLIFLLVSWAIIRSAVLSALRKHSEEQRAANFHSE